MDHPTCITCRWLGRTGHTSQQATASQSGCRRHAPGSGYWTFPPVDPSLDWCGDHEPQEGEASKAGGVMDLECRECEKGTPTEELYGLVYHKIESLDTHSLCHKWNDLHARPIKKKAPEVPPEG